MDMQERITTALDLTLTLSPTARKEGQVKIAKIRAIVDPCDAERAEFDSTLRRMSRERVVRTYEATDFRFVTDDDWAGGLPGLDEYTGKMWICRV